MSKDNNQTVISKSERIRQVLKVLNRHQPIFKMTPVKLREIMEDLGPTYVKIGQIMSSRTDLISPEYAAELAKLRSDVNEMDWPTVESILVEAYGKPVNEVFESFDEKPIGSASMAQVHKAVLKNGDVVAVKIQRPHIHEQMEVDVEILKEFSGLLKFDKILTSVVDPKAVLDEFWQSAQEEMNFLEEAANMRQFGKNFKDCAYVRVPHPYDDLTRKNVLVMEDIDGVQIDDYAVLEKEGYSRKEIAVKLCVCYLNQVINYALFHADPHSGNLKVADGKICWLDFGMMGRLSMADANAIRNIFHSIVTNDMDELTQGVLVMSDYDGEMDEQALRRDLQRFLDKVMSLSLDQIDVATLFNEMLEICHRHGIRMPQSITMLARSLVTLEGTVKDLDQSVSILEVVHDSSSEVLGANMQKQIDMELKDLAKNARDVFHLPAGILTLLNTMNKGQLTMNLSVKETNIILPYMKKMLDQLIVCILIASLLMGSSIICTTELKPKFLDIPLLGLAGFFLSFCLSLWLFFKMLINKKDRVF